MSNLFTEQDVTDQGDKTFFITGANTGLGFEVARVLAVNGGRVLLGCRSEHRAKEAIERILTISPEADLEYIPLDLASLSSIKTAADRVNQEPRLDVLINNAAVMNVPNSKTSDGFEMHWGVNHLGPFALTLQLLPKLNEQATARVVHTSSIAHRSAQIDFDDLAAEKSYQAGKRYGQSKLANLLFMFELQRRLDAVGSATVSVGCHPGIAETDLPRHMSPWIVSLFKLVRPLLNTAAMGAWPTLLAAVGPHVDGGDYFGPSKRGETAGPASSAHLSANSRDSKVASRLWHVSSEMTGESL